MDSILKQPNPLVIGSGDPALCWKKFKKQFDIYMLASNGNSLPEARKAALLLHTAGTEAQEIYESFQLSDEDKLNLTKMMEKFDDYFIPKTNISIERYKFNSRVQSSCENFEAFYTDLLKLAASCDFGNLKDELIKDRIICGIKDGRVKNRLLREEKLDLNKTIAICKAAEESDKHLMMLQKPNSMEVHGVQRNAKKVDTWKNRIPQHNKNNHKSPVASSQQKKQVGAYTPTSFRPRVCSKCGTKHPYAKCPAFGEICSKCKGKNHFSRMCKPICVQELQCALPEADSTDCQSEQFLLNLNSSVNVINKDWYVIIYIKDCNCNVKFKVDTGAHINVLPEYMYNNLNCTAYIKPYTGTISSYGGTQLNVVGCCNLTVIVNQQVYNLEFVVIKTQHNAIPIIGLADCERLNLITKNQNVFEIRTMFDQLMTEYEHLFAGVGKIKNIKCDFKLKPGYEPVTVPARRIPFSMRNEVKSELERLCKENIICVVTEPTEFVSPLLVLAKPNKKLRLVLDPHHLNEALYRELYQLPTFEEITSTIIGSKIFSTLDANRGFWQIELTEKASKLTTFSSPFGRFRFLRLPFGLRNAPEIFHRIFSEIFSDIPGVKIYIDDIIVYAKSVEEHNKILKQVFARANEFGVRFNKEKCKFLLKEIKYVGHILSEHGISPDPDKVSAIKNIQEPKNLKELQRFLGTVNYLGKFIPNLAELTYNLRSLNKKNVLFTWTDIHKKEFDNLKNLLTSETVLAYFDQNADLVLSVDSSKHGLGAVILQNGRPIAYASKALTPTQQDYSQMEKEALAITFGCQRFHQYLFGKQFTVESDHKPLETIFKRPLDKCPFRLKHLKATLNQYSFVVRYKPGAKLFIADNLSRDSIDTCNFNLVENLIDSQVLLLEYVDVTDGTKSLIKNETLLDGELQALKNQIVNGWPSTKDKIPDIIKPYWKIKDELSVVGDIILKGEQFIIPKSLRIHIINKLHYNHMGIQKTLCKAKELVYWPCMSNDITVKIKNCTSCLLHSNNNCKETIILNSPKNLRPWQEIATDIFHFDNKNYLLIVDKYSKYPEICCLNHDTRYENFINHFKSILARHGKPDIIYSDNGPQYFNQYFRKFLYDWDIKHVTSSPKYPQSNGFIERHVQTIKNLLKKTLHSNKDIYLALLEYRNTPLDTITPSPAQLLFGRRLKGSLPITEKLLKPKIVSKPDTSKIMRKTQIYYNQNAKNLPELNIDDRVIISNLNDDNKWELGTVVKVDNLRPRSYHVRLDKNGKIYIRNRRFIKKCDIPYNCDEQFKSELENIIAKYTHDQSHSDISNSNSSSSVINDTSNKINGNLSVSEPTSKVANNSHGNNIVVRRSSRNVKLPRRFIDYQMYK